MSKTSFPNRRLHTFHGGIHPAENKQQSTQTAIRSAGIPPQLVIPISQPGYREVELLVEVGQAVLKGQAIARGKQDMGVVYHASSSGVVTDISEQAVANASALPELCITIDSDGRDQWIERPAPGDYRQLTTDGLLALIADAGISGLGGAGFPTHIKLSAAKTARTQPEQAIKTLVINAAECEPFITADDMLMRERSKEVLTGIRILMQLIGPEQCLIGIEDNKPEAIALMKGAASGDDNIHVVPLPTLYPSGSEKQLIYLLTGIEIPSGGLPAQRGILCQNVGTAYAIARAVCHGEPLISRITTITGAAVAKPGNMEVLIGTPMDYLLQQCDFDPTQCSRLIMGGSMMGINLQRADLPIQKISNCIIATTETELPRPGPAQACIRCGMCAAACPVSLLPQQLYWFARSKEHDKAKQHNLFDCIECGACAYVCPSNIPLVQYYRAAKGEIREETAKHLRGENAQKRYEFHLQRLEKEKALQEKRRRERAELAQRRKQQEMQGQGETKENAAAQDAIQAALARVKARKAQQQQDKDKQNTPQTPQPSTHTRDSEE